MKNSSIKHIITFIAVAFCSSAIFAQIPENIVTEGSNPLESDFLDDIVESNLMLDGRILPYAQLREADVPWKKKIWRVIDVREKINQPFVYPENPLFKVLIEGVKNGELTAFTKDDFKTIMEDEAINEILFRKDTIRKTDPITYEETIEVVESELDYESIKSYRVKEIWYFDKKHSRMKVRILGVAPITETLDEITGDVKYSGPMFWIYFPEAREPMSRQQVFTEWNDAAPMTWADLFEMRKFSSYIFKQTNVQDFRLKDYMDTRGWTDIDRLIESERIKQELFNFEHDFWEY